VRSFTRSQLFSAMSPFLTTTKNSVRRGHSCTCSSTSPFGHNELCRPGHSCIHPHLSSATMNSAQQATAVFIHISRRPQGTPGPYHSYNYPHLSSATIKYVHHVTAVLIHISLRPLRTQFVRPQLYLSTSSSAPMNFAHLVTTALTHIFLRPQ
jgi:hypothetical protein